MWARAEREPGHRCCSAVSAVVPLHPHLGRKAFWCSCIPDWVALSFSRHQGKIINVFPGHWLLISEFCPCIVQETCGYESPKYCPICAEAEVVVCKICCSKPLKSHQQYVYSAAVSSRSSRGKGLVVQNGFIGKATHAWVIYIVHDSSSGVNAASWRANFGFLHTFHGCGPTVREDDRGCCKKKLMSYLLQCLEVHPESAVVFV